MNWTKIFLKVNAIIFLVFGLVCLFNPATMLAGIGAEISGGDGLYEMRGIFGGVSLGAAILCAMGGLKENMQRPALIFLLTYMGGYVFARIVGVAFDGFPQPKMVLIMAFEAITAAISLYALKRIS